MVDVGHTCSFRLLSHQFRRRTLGSNKQDFLLLVSQFGDCIEGCIQRGEGIFEVDNMDFISGAKDILLHFWVPVATLVPEMHSCTEHFFHADGHVVSFGSG